MKRIGFLFSVFLLTAVCCYAQVRCDFNDVDGPALDDVAILRARLDMGDGASLSQIQSRALEIYSSTKIPLTRIPSTSTDDINGNGDFDLQDVALFLAWLDMGSAASAQSIESRAREIYPRISTGFVNSPGVDLVRDPLPLDNIVKNVILDDLKIQIKSIPLDLFVTTSVTSDEIRVESEFDLAGTLQKGVVLLKFSGKKTADDFNSLSFSPKLPVGTVIQIYNGDK